MKAVKFGGTSMATVESIRTVRNIILSDSERRFVVVSAPGKALGAKKVTDMLIEVHKAEPSKRGEAFSAVKARFAALIKGLELRENLLDKEFAEIEAKLPHASYDYVVSRGEYLCAKLLAEYVGYEFVDAEGLVYFRDGSHYDDERTEMCCEHGLKGHNRVVVPGFYGSDGNGNIVTFSRGGSDISGAIVARAVGASVYENFTDVDGFMTCDPRCVPHAALLDILTYDELRELAYMGANVLHPESIFPVRKANIPIHILNTFNECSIGTKIVPTDDFLAGRYADTSGVRVGHFLFGLGINLLQPL